MAASVVYDGPIMVKVHYKSVLYVLNAQNSLGAITEKDFRFKTFVLPCNFNGCGWGPRNFAILSSSYDIIAYLDDDNWWEPIHLETTYECLMKNGVDFVSSGTKTYDLNGNFLYERIEVPAPRHGSIDTSEIMHRRHVVTKYGYWRYRPECCDWDLIERWLKSGATWRHTGVHTVNYTLRPGPVGNPRKIKYE